MHPLPFSLALVPSKKPTAGRRSGCSDFSACLIMRQSAANARARRVTPAALTDIHGDERSAADLNFLSVRGNLV
jgi:hypothetical protein